MPRAPAPVLDRPRAAGDDRAATHHLETVAVATGYDPAQAWGAIKPPLVLSSTFAYPSAHAARDAHRAHFETTENAPHIYARLGHPNLAMLEARFAALDGAEEAACFASGMAAIATTLLCAAKPGESVLHTTPLYGGTHHFLTEVLAERGITAIALGSCSDHARLSAAAEGRRIAAIFVETPANPTLELTDIAAISEFAASRDANAGRPVVIVDNTFLGPLAQRPLEHGADVSITSLTKYAGGHSDVMGGAVAGSHARIAPLRALRTSLGNHLDPFSAWLLLRSLETLPVRVSRAGKTAAALAKFLAGHPRVASVRHLGLSPDDPDLYAHQCSGAGATFSFAVVGGEAEAFAMLDRLSLIRIAVSLGGSETTICHPASTTHYAVPEAVRRTVGVDAGTLRISVGLEHEDDLIADLSNALDAL